MNTITNVRMGLFAVGMLAAAGAQAGWGTGPQGPMTGYTPLYGPGYYGPAARPGAPWGQGQALRSRAPMAPARWPAPIAAAPQRTTAQSVPYGYRWRPAAPMAPGMPGGYRPMRPMPYGPMPAWMAQQPTPRYAAQGPGAPGVRSAAHQAPGYQVPGHQAGTAPGLYPGMAYSYAPSMPRASAGMPGAPTAMRPAVQPAWADAYRFRRAHAPMAAYPVAWRQPAGPALSRPMPTAPAMPAWGPGAARGVSPSAPSQTYSFRPDDRFNGMQAPQAAGAPGQRPVYPAAVQGPQMAAQAGPSGRVDPGVGRTWR